MKTRIKKLSNEIIRSFKPCYDPSELGIEESECLPIVEAIQKYRSKVRNNFDIIWILCREEIMSEKDMRLFAVWCARKALKLVGNPYKRSIEVCNVAEKFANGEATRDELKAARVASGFAFPVADDNAADAAYAAAYAAARAAADAAARAAAARAADAARAAADAADAAADAWSAAYADARDAQVEQLLTYF
jgi:hypothetical protein